MAKVAFIDADGNECFLGNPIFTFRIKDINPWSYNFKPFDMIEKHIKLLK